MHKRKTPLAEMPTPLPVPQLLTVDQVAVVLGLGKSTVYQLMKEEGLPYVEVRRGTRRVSVKGLTWWIAQQEQSTHPDFYEGPEKEPSEKAEKGPVSLKGYSKDAEGKETRLSAQMGTVRLFP